MDSFFLNQFDLNQTILLQFKLVSLNMCILLKLGTLVLQLMYVDILELNFGMKRGL